MSARRVLVLGGTAEARVLAANLVEAGVSVTSSLAGRVSQPRLPAGDVRIGGFGGPDGLCGWLRQHRVAAVVDATHPFAERISGSAVEACERAGVPMLRLERPGWCERQGDRWEWVDDLDQAAATVPKLGSRVLLATGRQGLAAFADVGEAWFLVRCVDPPEPPLPPRHRALLDRGPYFLEGELALIDKHQLDLVVTKDSGGTHTRAKLDAARARGVPVIVVHRPPRPDALTVVEPEEALAWALEACDLNSRPGGLPVLRQLPVGLRCAAEPPPQRPRPLLPPDSERLRKGPHTPPLESMRECSRPRRDL